MLRGTARLVARIGLPRSGSALYPTVRALSVAQFQHQQHAGQAANWTAVALALLSSTILLQSADCTNEGNAAAKRSALGLTLVADVVEAISPAVVNIISESSNNGFFAGASGGSGFIIRRDGFIVTNAHVIANGDADQIIVTMKSTRRRRAVVHALDTLSDLAVLRLLDVEDEVLPVAPLGRSAKVRAGEFVIAIGSPMLLQNSASFGIVSATARHASELGISNNRSEYIQTDAAVNTGNSGGPLVNLDGEVIGINTLKVKGADGISLAIPIDVAEKIVKQLIENKRVIRPFVGLKMQDMISPDEYSTNRSVPFHAMCVLLLSQPAGSIAARISIRPPRSPGRWWCWEWSRTPLQTDAV